VAAPAGAITFSQQTLPFSGLGNPHGIAADQAGDVFVADFNNNRVVELPAGSSTQQTLPFTGLSGPYGVAVDQAGDLFSSDFYNNRVVELSSSVPTGSLAFTPSSAPPDASIGVSSVSPCPLGGPWGSAEAKLTLSSPAGAAVPVVIGHTTLTVS
jgi:serine/threonine-protein kinase